MNKKAQEKRKKRIGDQYQAMRDKLWPDLEKSDLWSRTDKVGFTTIPRTMPYFHIIMNVLSDGKSVSATYMSLWCRVYDHSMVIINNYETMAFEAGFTGQRAVLAWKERMRKLVELGFIDLKPGTSGEFHYCLIYNPYLVIKKIHEDGLLTDQRCYNALFGRALDIGAENDLS